jgi:hypothetical protein
VNRFQGIKAIALAGMAMAGAGAFPNEARAQSRAQGEFQLTEATHWEKAILPEGKYQYTVETGSSRPVVRVQQVGGGFAANFVPKVPLRKEEQDHTQLVLHRAGDGMYVSSFHVRGLNAALDFSIPEDKDSDVNGEIAAPPNAVEPDERADDSPSRMFKIVNPGKMTLSISGAEKVYLNACRLIEEQFSRTVPVRPQLILHLGALENEVRYPNNEIMLKKWDEYRFAQAVVEIALHALVTSEERLRLSDQAVSLANTTVTVCDLKNCRN